MPGRRPEPAAGRPQGQDPRLPPRRPGRCLPQGLPPGQVPLQGLQSGRPHPPLGLRPGRDPTAAHPQGLHLQLTPVRRGVALPMEAGALLPVLPPTPALPTGGLKAAPQAVPPGAMALHPAAPLGHTAATAASAAAAGAIPPAVLPPHAAAADIAEAAAAAAAVDSAAAVPAVAEAGPPSEAAGGNPLVGTLTITDLQLDYKQLSTLRLT